MKQRGQTGSSHQVSHARQQSQSGLTVIELMIVFAVGGLILMIILLAIPALQRNSRNNQRKQDVQTILGAVSQWELNHSGNIPGPDTGNQYLQNARVKLTYYDIDTGAINVRPGSSGSPPSINAATNLDHVDIYNYQKCSTTGGGSTATGAGYSDVVALYAIETGSSSVAGKCQQL